MNSENQEKHPPPKFPVIAKALGFLAAFITVGLVSWATPDGNLVVTLVPALVIVLAMFGIALWRCRRRGA